MNTQAPQFSITGEYENAPVIFDGFILVEVISEALRLSTTMDAFVDSVAYMITDETSRLSGEDVAKLQEWYEGMNSVLVY